MKHITVNIDPQLLKENPEMETNFIKMFSREKLNEVYSDDEGYDFTESEIEQMSDKEFGKKRQKIRTAMAEGRVKSD